VKTFPGLATAHGFTDSNGYDRILATAAKQAALGWEVRATVESSRPVVTLTDRDGAPLAGARVEGEAERPLGDAPPVRLAFTPTTPGRFEADRALAPGNWEIDLTVTAEGGVFHATRRLIAR
jgi:nitrogen fixation protein FixH